MLAGGQIELNMGQGGVWGEQNCVVVVFVRVVVLHVQVCLF